MTKKSTLFRKATPCGVRLAKWRERCKLEVRKFKRDYRKDGPCGTLLKNGVAFFYGGDSIVYKPVGAFLEGNNQLSAISHHRSDKNKFYMQKLINYIKSVSAEMKNVRWPTRNQTVNFTLIVIGVSLFTAMMLGFFDTIFTLMLEKFIL